jgi:deoxyribodipyrimidine photo-lyase
MQVVPVFILDPFLLRKPAEKRHRFLFAAINALDDDLRQRGSRVIFREGVPVEQMTRLVAETGAKAIFAEEDTSPYSRRRDGEIATNLPLHLVTGATIHPPGMVCKPDGKPYAVFTPFSKAWRALPFPGGPDLPAPLRLPAVPELDSLALPVSPGVPDFPASEGEAQRRLAAFLAGPIYSYSEGRNQLDISGTSGLSPYLRFGLLSSRQAAAAAINLAQSSQDAASQLGCETWLNELIWREFYCAVLYNHPGVIKTAYYPAYRYIPWRDSPSDLRAWQDGLTGYPVIDAAMRQLAETGWMHNRARMIVASFLVKDLLVNWQAGEAWFMRCLVDGDPASNNGGWQWSAGVGTDAAPYFRIFNPVSQSIKHDPQGVYIRRYVPELRRVPLGYIHQPWSMPVDVQSSAGCRIGLDYPARIVDITQTKERTLNAYKYSKLLEVK